MPDGFNLNDRQRLFCDEYLVDLNITQAAIRAGYSEKSAHTVGWETLQNPKVQAYIQKRQQDRARRTEITQDKVLRELAKIGFSDQRQFAKWGPNGVRLVDSEDLTDEDAAAVAEVAETVTQYGGSMRCKLHDKTKALELIGRHLGMFVDKLEIDQIPALVMEFETPSESSE